MMKRFFWILAVVLAAVDAGAADWPRLLGPTHDCATSESGLLRKFPEGGLRILWETPLGSGFGGPAIVGKRLVLFHRLDGKEVVECRDAESGKLLWESGYEADYTPRYGGSLGPRTSPVIEKERVFTFGITGVLHCWDLATGKVLWKRDCAREYEMGPVFFGHGSTPLVLGDRLVVQLGGRHDGRPANTAAFDTASGRLLWIASHEWGASYASPVPATLHGRECVLVFAGGESRPPSGGLLIIDAADGKVLSAVAHRAGMAESVNASSPVVVASEKGKPARVFVSEAYTAGGLCVEVGKDFTARQAWRAEKFGMYWMTPLARDGCVYGFAGLNDRLAELVCHEAGSGRELWRSDLGGGFGRGSLLATLDGVLCLGESGALAWLELTPKGARVVERCTLFEAPETWTLPALSRGLLYVQQNERGRGGTKPRLICYDLRKK